MTDDTDTNEMESGEIEYYEEKPEYTPYEEMKSTELLDLLQDAREDWGVDTTDRRHWLTNDGLAWFLSAATIGLAVAAGLGVVDMEAIPPEMMYAILAAFGTAVAWAFGKGAVKWWRRGESK